MAIEPHSNNKAIQELLEKLNGQNREVNHEQLQGLLGGNEAGHFHLTAIQLQQLENAISMGNNHEALSGLLGGNSSGHFHLTQAEVNKLSSYPIFSSLNHETLQGLLGGNSNGHYHLTVDLLNKLINLPASGVAGAAATIQIGTVATGATGSNASVTNSGTASNAILNFVIPRGDKGDKGDKGDTGSQGSSGTGSSIAIINNLTSTRTDAALSAYQGKVLNDKINDKLDSSSVNYENWTFTLENGTTVTKRVMLG